MARHGERDDDLHDLTDQVIGIFEADDVVGDLQAAGFETERMAGREGRKHLDPSGTEHGIVGGLKRAAAALGDEVRILRTYEEALDEGKVVVAARIGEDDDGSVAVRIMREHHGDEMWRFEGGTHARV